MKSIYASKETSQAIWPDFIAHFRNDTTKASYQTDLDEVMNYLEKDFITFDKKDVRKYFEWQNSRVEAGELKASTMAKKIRECHSFAEYISEHIHTYEDLFSEYLPMIEKQEKYVKGIPIEDIDKLFSAASDDISAYCIMALLYRAGFTSTEITELKLQDVEEYADGVYIYIRARRKACYIPEDAVDILFRYLNQREDAEYLFYNKKKAKLNTMYISRMMKKYTSLAGIPAYSAENIRNSCGLTMFAYGAKEKHVAEQLGTTQIQIKRYNNMSYKNQLQRQAHELVTLRLVPPK